MDPSCSTKRAADSTPEQAVETIQSVAQPDDRGATAFSVGVHRSLTMSLTQLYSIATVLLAVNIVLILLLLARGSTFPVLTLFYRGAIFCCVFSAITSIVVLFPRPRYYDADGHLPRRAMFLPGNAERYHANLQRLDKALGKEEYSRDNYRIARTLRFKSVLLYAAITVCIAGMVCAAVGVVIPIIFLH